MTRWPEEKGATAPFGVTTADRSQCAVAPVVLTTV